MKHNSDHINQLHLHLMLLKALICSGHAVSLILTSPKKNLNCIVQLALLNVIPVTVINLNNLLFTSQFITLYLSSSFANVFLSFNSMS